MRSSIEASMVKANQTISIGNAAHQQKDITTDDDSLGKVSARRDDSRRKPVAVAERVAVKQRSRCAESGSGRRAPPGVASSGVGELIGRELRGMYEDVIAQPVPDRFLALLNKLEAGAISEEDGGRREERD
jgi:hypothetical protein